MASVPMACWTASSANAVMGGVEEAALELIAGVKQEDCAAVGFCGPALFLDGGGEAGAAAIAVGIGRRLAGHGLGVDGAVAGVEVVHMQDGKAVGCFGRRLSVSEAGEGKGANGAEQDAAGKKHVWYPSGWGCVATWHCPNLGQKKDQ